MRNKNNLKIPSLESSPLLSSGFQTARNPTKKTLLSDDDYDDEDMQQSFNKERKM